ncbi:CTLH/CRA C-terminal to LisH motif domain containing protein [Trema orientale]|uniref:CTLH/CRA C-terminal to LisH motif domain containing protein n=1 Tax=Trema orientale TaxID=63057 RepID=A0A2P5FYD1_TREOI|nr:CTLH/CRA C-terminal to LisH motif domain containing protein [Trema orientale]
MESSSAPVNWEALDALVIDFAKSENLIEDSSTSSPSPSSVHSPPSSSSSPSLSSSSYHSRLIIRQIRRSLESGEVDAAIDLLRAHAPFILDDHRLLFRLHKQKFIELLRRGTVEDRDSAISCLRTSLAPCALDAYPEAYEEFKHVLLAFIYDKDDHTSPVANEWSERRRLDIAGLLSTVLRAHLHAYDPIFSMTLRYLISIHKGFCFRQGVFSPISDLTERLLLEDRDPPATPQESLYEAPPFDEVDIQALAHAVELTRQGAVDSLRFAKGDLFQAFQNELCRMKLDVSMLDELVHEYCVYRGIVDSVVASPSGIQPFSKPLKVDQPVLGICSPGALSVEVDCSASKHSEGDSSISHMDVSPEKNVNAASTQGIDLELRYACEPTSIHEDCSTSGSQAQQPENLRVQQRSRASAGERSKRKRWRGRHNDVCYTPSISSDESSKQELTTSNTFVSREHQGSERHSLLDINNRMDKYEIVLGMKELASKGMAAEVVEEVNALDPNFFVQNPTLLFQLKQVEFLKLVSSGDYSSALRVACSHLGPLASSDPTLLKPLKETLLALLQPNEEALGKGLPLHALASSLQVAIGKRLGIEEPQLMKIIRTTLHSHNEWFKLQMCKDRFENLLQIDSLKEANPSLLTTLATSKSNTDRSSIGSPQVTQSSSSRMSEDGSSPTQVSSRDIVCDENAILKVMEFLALPRADAIHLLAQYNGNAETVIQQIFA